MASSSAPAPTYPTLFPPSSAYSAESLKVKAASLEEENEEDSNFFTPFQNLMTFLGDFENTVSVFGCCFLEYTPISGLGEELGPPEGCSAGAGSGS
jgi:hypothetical protein